MAPTAAHDVPGDQDLAALATALGETLRANRHRLVHSGATIATAVTGIAGPGGGIDDKPVGTVWIAWKKRGGYAAAELFRFDGNREAVRRQSVAAALRGLEALGG